jgi:hypothetical protein
VHDTSTLVQLHRGANHLHALVPSAVAGLIEDLAARIGGMPAAVGLPAEYEMRRKPTKFRCTRRKSFGRIAPSEVAR